MRLVPSDFLTESDLEMRAVLDSHPFLKKQLTILLNSYRSLVHHCMKEMEHKHLDTADTLRSCAKDDNMAWRMGIPLLNTTEDWIKAWDSDGEEKEKTPEEFIQFLDSFET